MRRFILPALAGISLVSCSHAPASAPVRFAADQASLVAADEQQRRAVVAGDTAAIRAMMHPDYQVNAPTNRVMSRDEILTMFERGVITAEPVERTVEVATVSGEVGIVMGNERVVPPAGSQLAQAFGEEPMLRRFTNIYRFDGGRWWFIGRHFSIVSP